MQRYKLIFSSFHTIYRLATTLSDLKSFCAGICRLFRKILKADKVVMICKIANSNSYLKIRIENKEQHIKKGGKSILTRIEREILSQEREIIFNNRLIYPFIFANTLGAIYVKRDTNSKNLDETERAWFLALCEEVSIALKIFNLQQEQHKIMISYIKSLSTMLSQYVPTSYLDAKAISKLINAMGKAVKLSEAEIQSLKHAALLHDAGKIKLPSNLLKKQKPLTSEEYKIIEKHPRKGVELFRNLELLRPAIPIILHHHERYDGTGYPSKLKKDKIPVGSRILTILDTFDAMYFGRPYRTSRTLADIEKEFKRQRGKQFDPKLVDIFLKILKRENIQKFLKTHSKKT